MPFREFHRHVSENLGYTGIKEMPEYFWKVQDSIPSGMGYPLFGFKHIISVAVTMLLVVLGICVIGRLEERSRKKVLKSIPVFMLFLEIFKDVFLISAHSFGIGYLPLHICSLGIFIFLLREYATSLKIKYFCGEVSYVLIMPASLAALLFPDWTVFYPVLTFMNLYSYLWHGLLLLYPLLLRMTGEIRPSIRNIYCPILFLVVVTPLIYWFDRNYNCNYLFFIDPPEKTPLEWIMSVAGSSGYIAGYVALVIIVLCVVYLLDNTIARMSGFREA